MDGEQEALHGRVSGLETSVRDLGQLLSRLTDARARRSAKSAVRGTAVELAGFVLLVAGVYEVAGSGAALLAAGALLWLVAQGLGSAPAGGRRRPKLRRRSRGSSG